MKFRLVLGAVVMVVLTAVAATGIASAAPGNKLVCSGGDFATGTFTPITSGNYSSITVTGACQVQAGAVINVTGNINVDAGAVLDAQSFSSTMSGRAVFGMRQTPFTPSGTVPVARSGAVPGPS